MSPINSPLSHNHHQITIPSLSSLFDSDARYQFHTGQRASIEVIKQLSDDGVWLIGFKGRALRARSTVPLVRGARLPVTLFVDQDTLLLRIAAADRGSAVRQFSGSGAEFERAIAMLIDKGFSRDLPTLAQLLLHGRPEQHGYYGGGSAYKHSGGGDDGGHGGGHGGGGGDQQQRDEQRERRDADEEQERNSRATPPISAGDRERLLMLFNLLPSDSGGDCWRVVPFELGEPPICGTIRMRIRVTSGAAEEAVVVIDRSDLAHGRWAISVRALNAAHPRVTIYAENAPLLHSVQRLQQRLTRLLQHAGVEEVIVKRWDYAFDGFSEEGRAVSGGVNINV